MGSTPPVDGPGRVPTQRLLIREEAETLVVRLGSRFGWDHGTAWSSSEPGRTRGPATVSPSSGARKMPTESSSSGSAQETTVEAASNRPNACSAHG